MNVSVQSVRTQRTEVTIGVVRSWLSFNNTEVRGPWVGDSLKVRSVITRNSDSSRVWGRIERRHRVWNDVEHLPPPSFWVGFPVRHE